MLALAPGGKRLRHSLEKVAVKSLNTSAARTVGLRWVFCVLAWVFPVAGQLRV